MHLLGAEDLAMVEVWQAWRGRRGHMVAGGLGAATVTELPGVPVLPFAGGYLDQPALLLDALRHMDAIESRIPAGDGED